ncbi:hypothetical protein BD769DRAFT_1416807 [Suillus cothurnatus]|nr:hypothetical protein BD769DRAFT_1416807 [Suillus cothurnatus]
MQRTFFAFYCTFIFSSQSFLFSTCNVIHRVSVLIFVDRTFLFYSALLLINAIPNQWHTHRNVFATRPRKTLGESSNESR